MKTADIKINSLNDACSFIKAANAVDGDITVTKGRYIVNGKSIMGILSLDMSDSVTIEYPEDAIIFEKAISSFIVD